MKEEKLTKEKHQTIQIIMYVFIMLQHIIAFSNTELEVVGKWIYSILTICYGVFAFLSGYNILRNYNLKKTLKKTGKFILNYTIIFLIFLSIAIVKYTDYVNLKFVVLNYLGLDKRLMNFNWYVLVIFLTPILGYVLYKIKSKWIDVILIVISGATTFLMHYYMMDKCFQVRLLSVALTCFFEGYIVKKYGILSKASSIIKSNWLIFITLTILTCFIQVVLYDLIDTTSLIFTVLFFILIFSIIIPDKNIFGGSYIKEIGEYSWLLSGLCFNFFLPFISSKYLFVEILINGIIIITIALSYFLIKMEMKFIFKSKKTKEIIDN